MSKTSINIIDMYINADEKLLLSQILKSEKERQRKALDKLLEYTNKVKLLKEQLKDPILRRGAIVNVKGWLEYYTNELEDIKKELMYKN
jgi:hypothetical protein